MILLLTWVGVFIFSLFILIKSSDYFTDSAENIGLFFGLPSFVIGVTIVAIGTSLPELGTSILAVLRSSSEIVVADVIGSNITNIFLALGVVAVMSKKIKITNELIRVDLPLLIGSAFLLAITIWDGVFTLPEAIFFILGISLYLVYTIQSQERHEDPEIKRKVKSEIKKLHKLGSKDIIILIIGAIFIYLGAKYTIESIIQLSKILSIGTEIIAVSAVALGTSLPELMVCITAAKKGKPEMAVGNVLG